jgi:hypothetical protein
MSYAALVATNSHRSHAADRKSLNAGCGVPGHQTAVVSALKVTLRFTAAAALFVAGARMFSTVALLPVGWTLVSVAAGILASTFLQSAKALRGDCDECDDESFNRAAWNYTTA